MSLNPAKLQEPLRKLRKLLKKFPRQPSPKQVHNLRTRSRRIEAMLQALTLTSRRNERRLLQELAPVRKKAGKVRDMDVLTEFSIAQSMAHSSISDSELFSDLPQTEPLRLELNEFVTVYDPTWGATADTIVNSACPNGLVVSMFS